MQCWTCVMYVHQPSLLRTIANTHYGPVIGIVIQILSKAICCCLQTCNVDVVLFVMYCMCILLFIVTSAMKAINLNVIYTTL